MIRKDIDLNFIKNPLTGDINVKRNDDAVKQSLRTLMLMSLYEKPFNNELGADLRGFMFQNYITGTDQKIEERIRAVVTKYESGVSIKTLNVSTTDKNEITINLEYYFSGNTPTTLGITLGRTR